MRDPDVPQWITAALRRLAEGGGTTDDEITAFRERMRRYDQDPAERARIAGITADAERQDDT